MHITILLFDKIGRYIASLFITPGGIFIPSFFGEHAIHNIPLQPIGSFYFIRNCLRQNVGIVLCFHLYGIHTYRHHGRDGQFGARHIIRYFSFYRRNDFLFCRSIYKRTLHLSAILNQSGMNRHIKLRFHPCRLTRLGKFDRRDIGLGKEVTRIHFYIHDINVATMTGFRPDVDAIFIRVRTRCHVFKHWPVNSFHIHVISLMVGVKQYPVHLLFSRVHMIGIIPARLRADVAGRSITILQINGNI